VEKGEYLTVQLEPLTVQTGKRLNPTISSWDAGYFTEQLNEYGKNGWELASCFTTIKPELRTASTGGIFAMFKRKI